MLRPWIVSLLIAGVVVGLLVGQYAQADEVPTGIQEVRPTASPTPAGTAAPGDLLEELRDGNGSLGVGTRDHLSVCVDGDARTATEMAAVRQELDVIRNASAQNRERYGTPEAVEGCPPPLALSGPPPTSAVERHEMTDQTRLIWLPDTPSQHLVFVYFLPADVYAAYFGDVPYEDAGGEQLCEQGECWGVTVSLYLPESYDSSSLQFGLLDAIGIVPSSPSAWEGIDLQPCELGVSIPYCDIYQDERDIIGY